MVALVDLNLILLSFFLLSAKFKPSGHVEVDLPFSSPRPSIRCTLNEHFVVTLTKEAEIFLPDEREHLAGHPRKLSLQELEKMVRAFQDERRPINYVIRADRELPYPAVKEVLDMFQSQGIHRVELLTWLEAAPPL